MWYGKVVWHNLDYNSSFTSHFCSTFTFNLAQVAIIAPKITCFTGRPSALNNLNNHILLFLQETTHDMQWLVNRTCFHAHTTPLHRLSTSIWLGSGWDGVGSCHQMPPHPIRHAFCIRLAAGSHQIRTRSH